MPWQGKVADQISESISIFFCLNLNNFFSKKHFLNLFVLHCVTKFVTLKSNLKFFLVKMTFSRNMIPSILVPKKSDKTKVNT